MLCLCGFELYSRWVLLKEFEQIGLQNTKNMWRENVLAHAHVWRGSTQIEY